MELQVEIKGGAMLVRLAGEIDLAVADTLRTSLEEELDRNPGVRNIVINLGGVRYIDSSGLGVLLGRYRRISGDGGRMFIVGASPQVRRIVEMSGLLNIMQEFPSEADALNHAG
ncbi:MAG: anti-sigma factor antagonist [Peptococcaceae bacterium]|nr:anti-sigma factor antagonist [Peptococcaceae bacterium]